jgi:undecaprenyl pyrophosphate synthase
LPVTARNEIRAYTIETCARLKIDALALHASFRENWRRPKAEID